MLFLVQVSLLQSLVCLVNRRRYHDTVTYASPLYSRRLQLEIGRDMHWDTRDTDGSGLVR